MQFTVNERKITCEDITSLIGDNADYTVNFTFDEEWEGQTKTARFMLKNKYVDVILEEDACTIPVEILKQGILAVGVYADKITSTICEIPVKPSIKEKAGNVAAPADDVYAQLLKQMQVLEQGAVSDERISEALSTFMETDDTLVKNSEFDTKLNAYLPEYLTENGRINVKLFGVKSDGVTDCSELIQAIIDKYHWDYTIYFPNGTYLMKNILLPQKTKIVGDNSLTKFVLPTDAEDGDYMFCKVAESYGHNLFQDIHFYTECTNDVTAILSNDEGYIDYCTIYRNINIENFTNGILANCKNMEIRIENCGVGNCRNSGVYFRDNTDSGIINTNVSGCGHYGMWINGTTIKISNFKAYCNGSVATDSGLHLKGLGHQLYNVEIQENYADGIQFEDVCHSNINVFLDSNNNIEGTAQARINNCWNNNFNLIMRTNSFSMVEKEQAIVEQNGIVIEGINVGNNYNVPDYMPSYYKQDVSYLDKINDVPVYNVEKRNITEKYTFANYDYFNDETHDIDISEITPQYQEDLFSNVTLSSSNGVTIAEATLATIPSNSISNAIKISKTLDITVKNGDRVQIIGFGKIPKGTCATFALYEVIDDSWIHSSIEYNEACVSTEWNRFSVSYQISNFSEENISYKVVVQITIHLKNFDKLSAGETYRSYFKNLKYQVIKA